MNANSLPAPARYETFTTQVPESRAAAFQELINEFWCGASRFDQAATDHAKSLEAIERDGVESLHALFEISLGNSGQCHKVARFLAGLFNGGDYPFALNIFRGIDDDIFEHCMRVLRMDARLTRQEVHHYIGPEKFINMLYASGLAKQD
ncbi:DUF7673 family protein [Corticibacter populi]|nr:hypothetical protein [Corticibacter populi]RZS35489.1 hypothetical protein EV687_0557 [Corticibacter populi]